MKVNVSIQSLIAIKRSCGCNAIQMLGDSVKKLLWRAKGRTAIRIGELKELVEFQNTNPSLAIVKKSIVEDEIERLSKLEADINELICCFQETVNFDIILRQFKQMNKR